jgi:RNA polymerase sigma-70 factor (ECF subfamily)
LIRTRRSLLARLRNLSDQESWGDFFKIYWKLIYNVALRAGLNDMEAQEIVQETTITVARQMPGFQYDRSIGSFKGWLLLITRRRIADYFRKKYRNIRVEEPAPGATSRTALLERLPDTAPAALDEIWDQEWKQHFLTAALRRVKLQVDPKQFQIFDCYVLKSWPLKEVTAAFCVTANQVYIAKHRLAELLVREVERLERGINF